jgi:hypothetical protein
MWQDNLTPIVHIFNLLVCASRKSDADLLNWSRIFSAGYFAFVLSIRLRATIDAFDRLIFKRPVKFTIRDRVYRLVWFCDLLSA